MGTFVQKYSEVFKAPLNEVVCTGVSPQKLLNANFSLNSTDRITPYFRNYVHSRRKLGLFLRYNLCAVFGGRSSALTYRERFAALWLPRRAQGTSLVRGYKAKPLPRLSKFCNAGLRRHYWAPASGPVAPAFAVSYLPTLRFGLNPQMRLRHEYTLLGLLSLRAFVFPVWANVIRVCARKRLGLAVRANSYFNAIVPSFAFKVALGAGSLARGRRNRYIYADWIRRVPRRAKMYNRKRIMGRRYARLLWGVKRLRFFLSLCKQLRAVTNRLSRFRRLFYFRLVTFIASAFRIGSSTRVLMLIRAGHVFVNGRCIRNPKFQLSTLDVVSFSRIARPWVRRLRRLLPFRKRLRARRGGPCRRWRARVFRRAVQRFIVLGPKSTFAVVRSVQSMPHPVTLRGLERRPYMANGRIRFLLGTLQY